MELKYDNIHEYTLKCYNTTQITLDNDYNIQASKEDRGSIISAFGLVVTDGIRVNQDKAQVEGNLKYAVLYIGKGQEGGRLIPERLDGSLHFVENVNLSCDAADTDVTCKAYIEDLTIKPVNSSKISVKALVSITVTCDEITNANVAAQIS